MLCSMDNVVSCIARVARVSSCTILGQNVSCVRYKYEVNFKGILHDNTRGIINKDFPDLTDQRLINAPIDMFCVWNSSGILHGFTSVYVN